METLDAVKREGKDRLCPSLTNPNWLILRWRREIFKAWLAAIPGTNLRVLDIGGRIQPYRPLLESRIARYIAIDVRRSPLVDVVALAERIPLSDAEFDLVICTQVLEYIQDPAALIAEVHRILKPGGSLLLSAPAVFPRDSDEDLWRFSPASLRLLLRGFSYVAIAPEGSSLTGFVRTASVCLVRFAKPAFLGKVFRFTLVPAMNVVMRALELILATENDQFTANFSAIATK